MSALAFAGDSSAGPASAKAGSEALHQKMMQGAKDMQTMQMSGDVDHDFITMMRKHHQDGIAMAEVELKQGKDPQAKELARKIRDSQTAAGGSAEPLKRDEGASAPPATAAP